MAYGIVFLGAKIRITMLDGFNAGFADRQAPTISVTAYASTMSTPDLATLDLGITNTASTAAAAQDANSSKMNALTAGIKSLGVEAKDLKTSNYSLNPQYDYNQSPAVVVGYEANHTLTVSIRDSSLVSGVVAKAGDLGATNIGSVRYETEDKTLVEGQAREEAIAKAYEQGLAIADAMGARLGPVVSYSESSNPSYPSPYPYAMDSSAANEIIPDIQPGEEEVQMTVYIDFAIE